MEDKMKKLVGLTLDMALGVIDGNIKIGTEKGSGFVFCGTKDRFMAEIEDINYANIDKKQKTYEKAIRSLKEAIAKPHTDVSDYLKQLEKNATDISKINPTWEGYQTFVTRKLESIAKKSAQIDVYKDRANNYIPLEERVIKDAYLSTTQFEPVGTVILLIEGNEAGRAWTTEEFRNGLPEEVDDEDVA